MEQNRHDRRGNYFCCCRYYLHHFSFNFKLDKLDVFMLTSSIYDYRALFILNNDGCCNMASSGNLGNILIGQKSIYVSLSSVMKSKQPKMINPSLIHLYISNCSTRESMVYYTMSMKRLVFRTNISKQNQLNVRIHKRTPNRSRIFKVISSTVFSCPI